MTSVPQPTLGPTGYVIPTEAAVLAGVIADMQTAFGGNLNLSITNTSSLTTPQGQIASTMAAIIMDCYEQFLGYTAQTDPQYAQGVMQDGLGNLYFMTRIPAAGTTVTATVMGLPNTVIPANTPVVQDAAGNLYSCAGVTIPVGGQIAVVFTNMTTGPVIFSSPLSVYQTTPGWDGFYGAQTQTLLGNNVESSQQFEARRQASVASNGSGSTAAILAAVLSSGAALTIPNSPASVYVVDNPNNVSTVQGGVTLTANSVYVCAGGIPGYLPVGNAAAIAKSIWAHKDIGCSYTPSVVFNGTIAGTTLTINSLTTGVVAIGQTVVGNTVTAGTIITAGSGTSWTVSPSQSASAQAMTAATTVAVLDTSYSVSPPSYNVSFTVPVVINTNIMVTVAAASLPPSNALALLTNPTTGLITAFLGTDNGAPVSQIGQTIYSSRFYSTVQQILPATAVVATQVGVAGATFTGTTSGATLTVSGVTGTIAIGQTVTGIGCQGASGTAAPPTIIGGSGTTWTLSTSSLTLSGVALTATQFAYQQAVNINQIPWIGNVTLVLV